MLIGNKDRIIIHPPFFPGKINNFPILFAEIENISADFMRSPAQSA